MDDNYHVFYDEGEARHRADQLYRHTLKHQLVVKDERAGSYTVGTPAFFTQLGQDEVVIHDTRQQELPMFLRPQAN